MQRIIISSKAKQHKHAAGRRLGGSISPYFYLLPALLLVSVFLLYPVVFTVYLSFTKYDILTPPKWVGLNQYKVLFQDRTFFHSFQNTLIWVGTTLIIPIPLALLLATGMSGMPYSRGPKIMFFLPRVLAATSIGVIWLFVYSPDGILNEILIFLGASSLIHSWLIESPLNTFAIILTAVWAGIGWQMIMFLIGLQAIPGEIIEAANLEGASKWQTFWYMKLPLLKPMMTIVIIMSIIGSFTTFDLIWVMTQGGPYRSSETLAVSMYRGAFVLFKMGYGSAMAVLLSGIVLVFSIVYLYRIFRRES